MSTLPTPPKVQEVQEVQEVRELRIYHRVSHTERSCSVRWSEMTGWTENRGAMTEEIWTAVDRHFSDLLVSDDPALEAALAASAAAGLPAINVSPVQGKLLHLLVRAIGAREILEIGTLGGYSTIWLARALPEGGRMISLEADARHAEVARANIARAGLDDRVEVRLGMALDLLPELTERAEPFDLS